MRTPKTRFTAFKSYPEPHARAMFGLDERECPACSGSGVVPSDSAHRTHAGKGHGPCGACGGRGVA